MEKMNYEPVGQACGVQALAYDARTTMALGSTVRRPATGVHHAAVVF